jgi:hypothetical protein
MHELEKTLAEGYMAISGRPLQEGLFSWLFGGKKSPSEELIEKINRLFDRFYERERDRSDRRAFGASYGNPGLRYEDLDRIDSLRQAILREINKLGRQFDKAVKERDKAYEVRDSYSGKLDSMRDDRDSWRSKYNDAKRKK